MLINLDEEILEREVKEKWNFYPAQKKPVFGIAEDGSVNKKHYLGFYLYSVSGYALGKRSPDDNHWLEEILGEINVSFIKNTEFAESYFKLLMFLLEIKALIKLAEKEKPDVLLVDGTLSGRFIIPPPKTKWFINEEFSGELANLSGEFIKDLERDLFKYDITVFSKPIKEKVINKLIERFGNKGKRKDLLEATLSKLAYFEYFILLHHLFYKLDWNPIIIGVAKTSHDTQIFQKSVPDIKIFQHFIKEMGYSEVQYIEDIQSKSMMKEWEFSEVFEKRASEKANELKEIQIKFFYSKYHPRTGISLIEVYENAKLETIKPSDINDYLNYFSVAGYPFVLRKADKEVRITNRDMERIEELLNLKHEIKGREGLEK